MKRIATTFFALLVALVMPAQSRAAEQWWSYLASYDAGPGSVRLDLALRKQAPILEYPHLVVTGTTYVSKQKDGLPEISDLKRLNALHEKVVVTIGAHSPYVYAGTFTHNFEQLHYFYVKSTAGIEPALAVLYRDACQHCNPYTNIKSDAPWSAYLEFLYPNQATREYYGLQVK